MRRFSPYSAYLVIYALMLCIMITVGVLSAHRAPIEASPSFGSAAAPEAPDRAAQASSGEEPISP